MHAGQTPRHPMCFLTNGGGVTEQQKADELSSWLGVQVKENQAGTLDNTFSHPYRKKKTPQNLGSSHCQPDR